MATAEVIDDLHEDLFCPVCLDLFIDPVILVCGHNFCKSCIDKFWDSVEIPSCPECRAEWPAKKYTVNRFLAKMVKKACIVQEDKEGNPHQEQKSHHTPESQQCFAHKEALKLFCQEDEKPICLICMVSQKHAGHSFLTLQEAVGLCQDTLKTAASALQSKLNNFFELQSKQEQSMSYIKDKAKSLEQHITSEFAKLRKFLQDKEQQLILQLKEEKAGILGKIDLNLRKIKEKTEAIHKQIIDIQLKLQQEDDLLFLTSFRDETKRLTKIQEQKDDTEPTLVSGDLSLGIYKGPLQYKIWKEMLSILNPGDKGYPLEHWLITPIWNTMEAAEEHFKTTLMQTQIVIE